MRIPIILLALAAAACSEGQPTANEVWANQTATNSTVAPDLIRGPASSPASAQVSPRAIKEETEDFTLSYSWPAAAAAIPGVAAWLEDDKNKARASIAKDAAEFRREMAKDGFPFRKYDSTTEWKTVAETPRVLSLSAETYVYTGGAHGSPGFDALLWDKANARTLRPIDVFTSEAALQKAVGPRFCDLLDAERAKRRGAPVVRSDDPFNDCIGIDDSTVILGSSNGRAIDRLGFLIGPYAAGSYAEGSYDLTIPVNPAVLASVKPAWRSAFATR